MDWSTAFNGVTAAVALLALVGSVFTYRRAVLRESKADRVAATARDEARAAQKRADEAAARAELAITRANVSWERSAKALERANDLAEKAIPKIEVQWSAAKRDRGRAHYRIANIGTGIARDVRLVGHHDGFILADSDDPQDVPPMGEVGFDAMNAGGRAAVRVEWIGENGDPCSTTRFV